MADGRLRCRAAECIPWCGVPQMIAGSSFVTLKRSAFAGSGPLCGTGRPSGYRSRPAGSGPGPCPSGILRPFRGVAGFRDYGFAALDNSFPAHFVVRDSAHRSTNGPANSSTNRFPIRWSHDLCIIVWVK